MYNNHYESFLFTGRYIGYRPVVLLNSGEYEIAVKRAEEFEELAAWRGVSMPHAALWVVQP